MGVIETQLPGEGVHWLSVWEEFSNFALDVRVVPINSTKAVVELFNPSDADLFTWRVACPFAFTLVDRSKVVYASTGSESGEEIFFDHVLSENGVIPRKQSKTFVFEAVGQSLNDVKDQKCQVNGIPLRLDIQSF